MAAHNRTINGAGAGTAGRRRGFTLVELMAAMTLAVLIMISVAHIFKEASTMVEDTEAISSGYQAGRGVMTTLQRDLSRFAPQGYLRIVPVDLSLRHTWVGSTGSKTTVSSLYRFDTLIFTALGRFEEMGRDLGANVAPAESTSAEILYTFAAREDGSSDDVFVREKRNIGGSLFIDDDARTMVLVRKAFLGSRQTSGYVSGPALTARQFTSQSRSCLPMMALDRWADYGRKEEPYYRLQPPPEMNILTNGQPLVNVRPSGNTFPRYDASVNLVVADRISEFAVEYWGRKGDGTYGWIRPDPDHNDARRMMHWTGVGRYPHNNQRQLLMPSMIRVTVCLHSPNDSAWLEDEGYADRIAEYQAPKYRGMVFRQVFALPQAAGVTKPEYVQ